jgi:hypothetical protein
VLWLRARPGALLPGGGEQDVVMDDVVAAFLDAASMAVGLLERAELAERWGKIASCRSSRWRPWRVTCCGG